MPRVGRHVRVTGRVQGVFFRAWTAEQARALGVTGWVRNCPDGSVTGHLGGEEPAVQQLIELLHQGPPSAQVAAVDVEVVELEVSDRFEIKH
ncbi:acylphosphatase [Sphingomonas sp. G124]|uniref:Acylphosphatase n=1 Tax=Sphingomonas cremea TaxID=2904799 RepID=A0A9X1QKJ6_9SPHN|nr:acylphosphatase [Sphingomonas cremea]MCF2515356.1 acylphosphatase [Sphingomonas cremea]